MLSESIGRRSLVLSAIRFSRCGQSRVISIRWCCGPAVLRSINRSMRSSRPFHPDLSFSTSVTVWCPIRRSHMLSSFWREFAARRTAEEL
jgi:hypothetical protein